eukprot:1117109-Rhodomonas_salina.1
MGELRGLELQGEAGGTCAAMGLRARYAMSGTDAAAAAYAPMLCSYNISGTDGAYAPTQMRWRMRPAQLSLLGIRDYVDQQRMLLYFAAMSCAVLIDVRIEAEEPVVVVRVRLTYRVQMNLRSDVSRTDESALADAKDKQLPRSPTTTGLPPIRCPVLTFVPAVADEYQLSCSCTSIGQRVLMFGVYLYQQWPTRTNFRACLYQEWREIVHETKIEQREQMAGSSPMLRRWMQFLFGPFLEPAWSLFGTYLVPLWDLLSTNLGKVLTVSGGAARDGQVLFAVARQVGDQQAQPQDPRQDGLPVRALAR